MNDDWQPGDVAICVDARPYEYDDGVLTGEPCELVLGREYLVTGVEWDYAYWLDDETPDKTSEKICCLWLLEVKSVLGGSFDARSFVKRRSLLDENERETSRELDPEAA